MAQRNRLLEMVQGQAAPPGASAAPVGTDALPTADLGAGPEAPAAAPAAEAAPEGETESQNAIMEAMNGGEQLTPEQEEMIKARLNLAARQRLLGGSL